MIINIVLTVYMALGLLTSILLIGKTRKPITPGDVVAQLVINGTLIALIWLLS